MTTDDGVRSIATTSVQARGVPAVRHLAPHDGIEDELRREDRLARHARPGHTATLLPDGALHMKPTWSIWMAGALLGPALAPDGDTVSRFRGRLRQTFRASAGPGGCRLAQPVRIGWRKKQRR